MFRADNEYELFLEGGVARLVDGARKDKWLRTEGNVRAREIPDFSLKEHPDAEDVVIIVGTTRELPRMIEAMQRVLGLPTPTTPTPGEHEDRQADSGEHQEAPRR